MHYRHLLDLSEYDLQITDRNQVLLVSHVRRLGPAAAPPPGPVLLILEFCYLTVNLSFENELLNLTGRVLPAERILQGARAYEYNPCDADWSKEMRGLPLMTSMPLEIWLLSHTRRNADVAHSLLQTLNKVPVGIHLQRPGMMEYDDRQEALLRALQQRVVQQVQMVVVILSTNRKDKYDCVKKYLCVDCPTPSQCVVARTLSRPQTLMTIATKISLQMNCKMEGEPWSAEIPVRFCSSSTGSFSSN
ncbi:piwi-like protein 1 [Ictalurus punctatus]|uniref:Piwi-like protein 1 n=1 Tax=Ictalurus punctatus TaxID=7998 RepID=A0A9F7QWL2_ICTPU|nr:piwi-like protein 1 [Ictalurus punctatus]